MTLCIIATGGTFDKHYDPLTGELRFADSHLPQALQRSRLGAEVRLRQLPPLDSLDMQDADRLRILAACRTAPENRLVIIHGTDTMTETARVLGSAGLTQTVILTGAMVPYEVAGSDALFNLGFACGVAQTLSPGIYIAMNGTVFPWDKVRKNRAVGRFELV